MAYFRKRDNGWEYRISYKDATGKYRQKSKSGFKTKKAAELEANKAELLISEGLVSANNSSFKDYFLEWAELYKKEHVTATTWNKYAYTHQKIGVYFGDTKIKAVSASMYQKVLNDFRSTHSWQTVKMFNTHIRQCVKMALHEGIISKDFTAFAKIAKEDRDGQGDFLELDEYKKIIELTGSEIKHKSHFFIYLVAVTGLRFSEAMGIDISDIDRENKLIHITKTYKVYGPSKGYGPTKNESSIRDVPINDQTLGLIDQYIDAFKVEKRLFEGLSNSAVNRALKRMVGRDVHVHSLRHTFVSYLISQNVELLSISHVIGHSNLNTTLSVYAHLLKDQKERDNDKIRALFGAELGRK